MEGKVAIVTGASSGIGRATAIGFVRRGATVVGVGRNEAELATLRDEAREHSGALRIHLADVTEFTQVDRLVTETAEHFGRIDVLVNAAGTIKGGNIEDTTIDDWDKMMN